MNKYKLLVHKEVLGHIMLEAKDKTEAQNLVNTLLNKYGLDQLLTQTESIDEDLSKYTFQHIDSLQGVDHCQLIDQTNTTK